MRNEVDDLWGRVDAHLQTRLRPALYARNASGAITWSVPASSSVGRNGANQRYRHWFNEFLPHLGGAAQRVVFVADAHRGDVQDGPPPADGCPF